YILLFISSRRRHTMSKRDWSSDVCSSDLPLSYFFLIKILFPHFNQEEVAERMHNKISKCQTCYKKQQHDRQRPFQELCFFIHKSRSHKLPQEPAYKRDGKPDTDCYRCS